jgi:hypothetical protein
MYNTPRCQTATAWMTLFQWCHLSIFLVLQLPSVIIMCFIRELVQQALTTGYLTVEAEEQLRQLLQRKYDLDDLDAFIKLQQAAMCGQVKQESRELRDCDNFPYKKTRTIHWASETAGLAG